MLKLQYNVTYVSVATDSFFAHTPLLFGVWHSYKYCVTECYRRFLLLWAALEYKDFLTAPGTVLIVTNFNLSMMEQMVVAEFLAVGPVLPLLWDAQLNILHRREIYGGGAVKLQQLSALTTLFRDYAPALFYIGYRVRTLHWRRHAPWSGKEAYEVVQFCTVLLDALRPRGGRQQYMDALLLALLQWDPYMDALPSAAFSEEKVEATLSQLQQAKEDDPTIVTIQDHQKQYRFLNRKPNEPKDLTDPHVPRTFPARVVIRAKRLINAIQNGTLPFMRV